MKVRLCDICGHCMRMIQFYKCSIAMEMRRSEVARGEKRRNHLHVRYMFLDDSINPFRHPSEAISAIFRPYSIVEPYPVSQRDPCRNGRGW